MKRLLIFVVIYKAKVEDCVAYTTLMQNEGDIRIPHTIVVYNNSPEIEQTDNRCRIVNGMGNDMLAKAYNVGLSIAKEEGCEWILLMDQDTPFCKDYFKSACQFIESPNGCDMAVPTIIAGGKIASPTYYNPIIGPYLITNPITEIGKYEKYLTAFNSGAILRTSAIEEIGGFNEEYPLDALDNWYFHNLRKKNHYTYIMDCQLKQNLSLNNPSGISIARYKSIMNSAIRFAKSIGWVALLGWKVRAVARCFIQLMTPSKRRLFPITLKYLFVNEIK
ncbi:MAG: hypothetical protein MJZ33_04490 [Paludibacteraceae bacterium]|nr:hypothetical protein [Paludibacteraceae bacterium]